MRMSALARKIAARFGRRTEPAPGRTAPAAATVPATPRTDPVGPAEPFPDAMLVFAVDVLPRNFAGRTASMLNKTRLFAQQAGRESIMVTLYDSSQLDDIEHGWRAAGVLADGVRIASLHDFYPDDTVWTGADIPHPFEEPGMHAIHDPEAGQYHFFVNGVHRLSKRLDYAGRLIVLDHFNESHQRTRSDEFYPNGVTRRTVFFDLHYGVARQEVLHRRDGSVRLNIWWAVDPVTKIRSPQRVTTFDAAGRPEKVLRSYDEVIHTCLDNLIGDRHAFLHCEARRVDDWLLGYRRPNVKQLHVLHNAHIRPPYDDVHRIRPVYQPLLGQRSTVDAIVFLTDSQRAEAEAHFGHNDKFFVVPHAIRPPVLDPAITRDPRLVVMMARLDQQKQVDHAIDAFAKVVKQIPGARLEIYGRGVLAGDLQARIQRLGLTDHVVLAGFTTNPGAVYQRAALSLLTSKYEGFGLVLLESFSFGCPAVSYDLRYGPADIITDGRDGFLVPAGDRNRLAQRIVTVLTDPQLQAELSAAALAAVDRFGEEAFVARWSTLYRRLDAQGWGEPTAGPSTPEGSAVAG